MAKKIPVGDATEVPFPTADGRAPKLDPLPSGQVVSESVVTKPATLRAAGFDMGPGNSRVPSPGASPEAQAFKASTAPAATPAAPATPEGAWRSLRGGASALVRSSAPALIGVGAAAAQAAINARAEKPAPFEPPANAPGQIPVDPTLRAPDPVAMPSPLGIGPNNEFTRNVGNALNALPGVRPATDFLRAGSTAVRALTAGQGAQQAVRAAQGAAPTFAQPAAANEGPLDTRRFPPAPGAAPTDNVVTREGNAFSGTNIRQGFTYADGRPNTGTVTSLDTSQGLRQNLMELDRLRADAPVPAAAGGFNTGSAGGSLREIADSQRISSITDPINSLAKSTSGADRRLAASLGSAEANLATREQGETTRAGLRLANDRRGQDIGAATARAGQDIQREGLQVQREGQQSSRQIAVMNAQREQARSDRAYQLDVAKFGVDAAEKNRTARADEDKAITAQLETRFRTKDDKGKDVPDTAKVAMYKQAVATTLPAFIQMLQQSGTPQAQAKAKELSERGLAGLGPKDHALFQTLLDRRELARQTRGSITPGSSDFTDSDNLFDFMQRDGAAGLDKGVFSDRVVTANGSSIPMENLRYGADANVFLPNFSAPSTNQLRGLRTE